MQLQLRVDSMFSPEAREMFKQEDERFVPCLLYDARREQQHDVRRLRRSQAATCIDYDDPGGGDLAETLAMAINQEYDGPDEMSWDMSAMQHPRVNIAGVSTKLRFAVGLDTGCQTPVVRTGSTQDLLLKDRRACHVELLGFDDSCLIARETGTLEYYIGSHKISRKVLVVDGLHEDYLDSLSDVADVIFFRGGGSVGLDVGDDLQVFQTKSGASLPTLDVSVGLGQAAEANQTWTIVPTAEIFKCQRVMRGIHDKSFDDDLRKSILAFRKSNGLTVEELVHLKIGHQGWTSALKYELRKIYGSKFELPDCQCNACTAMAPDHDMRHRDVDFEVSLRHCQGSVFLTTCFM